MRPTTKFCAVTGCRKRSRWTICPSCASALSKMRLGKRTFAERIREAKLMLSRLKYASERYNLP